MDEKRAIELATAEGFLRLVNKLESETYRIVEHGDSPDFLCTNEQNDTLKFEVTLTEDRSHDIKALLGRSNHRDSDRSSKMPRASSLSENVAGMLIERIAAKLDKDYGRDVALVIRDTSPLDWPWETEVESIQNAIAESRNPYDRGIWIVNYHTTKLYRVV